MLKGKKLFHFNLSGVDVWITVELLYIEYYGSVKNILFIETIVHSDMFIEAWNICLLNKVSNCKFSS